MGWTAVLLLTLAAFLAGGVYSFAKQGKRNAAVILGILAAMALVGGLLPTVPWAHAVLGALVGLAWMWRLLQRRLQGFTGDGLGATQQVSEVLFYLGLALSVS